MKNAEICFMNRESYNAHPKKNHPIVIHKIIVLSPAHPYNCNVSRVNFLLTKLST